MFSKGWTWLTISRNQITKQKWKKTKKKSNNYWTIFTNKGLRQVNTVGDASFDHFGLFYNWKNEGLITLTKDTVVMLSGLWKIA
jgi:hypothetical protein